MKGLLVIDVQNDYVEGGAFPLWNTESTIENIKKSIKNFQEKNLPVILVQHVADPNQGLSPFFNKGTEGGKILDSILDLVPNAPIVQKSYADGFHNTNLEEVLTSLSIDEVYVCGMMTQNCVTHTAISKQGEKYCPKIIADACTTVNEMIHLIGLHAVSTRIEFANTDNL